MLHALALLLASATAAEPSTLSVKVVSLDFSYPYFGEPGNTCRRGSVYVRATADAKPVVVRLVDSAGLTPGAEAVLADIQRAGTGRDGTPVYCSSGRQGTQAPAPIVAAAPPADTQPPLVPAEPAAEATPAPAPAATATSDSRCMVRLFQIVKKSTGDKNFGPSTFDPDSALGAPEPVDCSLARSRVTNVLLVRMVKDGAAKPSSILGAEWAPGSWDKGTDEQRRVVKVYLSSPEEVAAQN
ncbi:MAG: hypothetical protein U0228_04770 [Myxococcaceae bacterium]